MAKRSNRNRNRPRPTTRGSGSPLTGEVVKAPSFPAGTVTQTPQQILGPQQGSRMFPAMPRDAADGYVPFAPGLPFLPQPINTPDLPSGRTSPRRYEYDVAWNLQLNDNRLIPYSLLRDVSVRCDLARRCVNVLKQMISGMEWDIALSPSAVKRIVSDAGEGKAHVEASKQAREDLMPEILRLTDFWAVPDRINGMSFQEWVSCLLEEVLVIDALSIYPNQVISSEGVHSLVILDGATIKPLLDERGNRPTPPHPAYQQILYGFPRGEFTVSDPADDNDQFTADALVYAPRNRRAFSPYGQSPIETALPLIDIYMKRQQWIRAEFTEGVVPELVIKTDANYGGNPALLEAYENVFNAALAGNTEARKRARLLPEGMDPIQLRNWAEKYKPDFDEQIVKDMTGHFGLLPSQIGFTPRSGLGGAGHQEGEAQSTDTIGIKPLVSWLTHLLNHISRHFLDMPQDLSFNFLGSRVETELERARMRQVELNSGQTTLNEIRSELGKPLFEFDEADMPFIVAGSTITFLESASEQPAMPGLIPGQDPMDPAAPGEPAGQPGGSQGGAGGIVGTPPRRASTTPVTASKSAELRAFKTYLSRRSGAKREFRFEHVSDTHAERLNRLAQVDKSAALDYANMLSGMIEA